MKENKILKLHVYTCNTYVYNIINNIIHNIIHNIYLHVRTCNTCTRVKLGDFYE